jgi:RecB family exonuclease
MRGMQSSVAAVRRWEEEVLTTRYIRQSELKKFKRCPRSWWLSYQREGNGYQFAARDKPQSGQRDVGTLVHKGLEAHYTGRGATEPIEAEYLCYLEDLGHKTPEWEKVYRLARVMCEGYVQWVEQTGVDQGEQTVACELTIELPIGEILGDEIILTGKIDRVVLDLLSGEMIIEDTKTVASLDAQEILAIDDQGQFYAMLASAHYGTRVNRFRHNMLRKVLRTATATPPFYGRQEVRFTEEQLDNAWQQQYSVVHRMVEALQVVEFDERQHQRVMYPTPNPQLCGWDCDFLHICPMMNNGDDWRGALAGSGIYVPRSNEREYE